MLAASLGAAVLIVGISARERHWPMWIVVICWLPALLVMSSRFDPRPELVSLIGHGGLSGRLAQDRPHARP